MANNTRSKDEMMWDLDVLTALTVLRLDITLDYRQYVREEQEKGFRRVEIFQNMRFYVAPDSETGEMRVFALAHQIAPLAFYTRQGAQRSLEAHQEEWQRLFRVLAITGSINND